MLLLAVRMHEPWEVRCGEAWLPTCCRRCCTGPLPWAVSLNKRSPSLSTELIKRSPSFNTPTQYHEGMYLSNAAIEDLISQPADPSGATCANAGTCDEQIPCSCCVTASAACLPPCKPRPMACEGSWLPCLAACWSASATCALCLLASLRACSSAAL